jgi:23S rRNA (pseudouridine1915-N3)-methyltransferase
MRVRFIWIGKTRDANLQALADQYLARLARFTNCEVTELADAAGRAGREGIAQESKRIIGALRRGATVILLDVEGVQWNSEQLAAHIERWQLEGSKEVTFVMGGPEGVSSEVSKSADLRLSLSRLTLTHEMTRVVLLEQIYRAYTIIHRLPYHK